MHNSRTNNTIQNQIWPYNPLISFSKNKYCFNFGIRPPKSLPKSKLNTTNAMDQQGWLVILSCGSKWNGQVQYLFLFFNLLNGNFTSHLYHTKSQRLKVRMQIIFWRVSQNFYHCCIYCSYIFKCLCLQRWLDREWK